MKVERLIPSSEAYRWTRSENLHLTLNFLGDVEHDVISELCRKLERVVKEHDRIPIKVAGMGAFPKIEKPRVLWLDIQEGRQEIVNLQYDLTTAIEELKLNRDRLQFHPHVTLARIKKDRGFDESVTQAIHENENIQLGEFLACEVIVFGSFLESAGPTYTPMARMKLL